jgi:hypothetical protein
LRVAPDGSARLDVAAWEAGADGFEARLTRALDYGEVEPFEHSEASSCAWQPFLREIEQRKPLFAKAQLAGPLIVCTALRLEDGRPVSALPRLERQIWRLARARLIAMARALRSRGTAPLLFLDDPSLGMPGAGAIAGIDAMRQLVLALRSEGARVGLHCCADAPWETALGLGLDLLSFDARLSLGSVLAVGAPLDRFCQAGGRLALGLVPTDGAAYDLESLVSSAADRLTARGETGRRLLRSALLTPACGLGLRSIADCERAFDDLSSARRLLSARLRA